MEENRQMSSFYSIPLGERSLGVFLEFQYMRVSINTLLCNPNLDIMKVFFPIPMDVGILPNHVKFVCFILFFSNFFIRNCYKNHKNWYQSVRFQCLGFLLRSST